MVHFHQVKKLFQKYDIKMENENAVDTLVKSIMDGKNVILHGPGGTGKSYTIRHAVTELRRRGFNVACTAATGIAAINLSGEGMTAYTIHKWGLGGLADKPVADLIKHIRTKPYLSERWRTTSILFIDEVSMIGEELFTKLSKIAKHFRKNPNPLIPQLPFGGIRVVVSGDFLQLPPVKDDWVFKSDEWKECEFEIQHFLSPKRYDDVEWFNTLLRIRCGHPSPEDIALLQSRKDAYTNLLHEESDSEYVILPTNLYSTRLSSDSVNSTELAKLPGEATIYEATDEIIFNEKYDRLPPHRKFKTTAYYEPFLDDSIPKRISLKVGAQVMLKWNVDTEGGLANGSRGVITGIFEDGVRVMWAIGKETLVTPETWEKQDEDALALRTQFPLVLAWAMTIHKSQGCTLDKVVCDIGKEIFSAGQVYVALSRVRSPAGLYLRSFVPSAIFADVDALEYLGLKATPSDEVVVV
jgi:ATP-dependent DNA helicase PIF1